MSNRKKQFCYHEPAKSLRQEQESDEEEMLVDDDPPPQRKPAAVPRAGHPSGRPVQYKDQVGSVTEVAAQAVAAPATMPPEPTHLPDFKDQVHGPPEPGSGNRSSNEKPAARSNLPVVFAVEAQPEPIVLAQNPPPSPPPPEVTDNSKRDSVPSDDADPQMALKQAMIKYGALVVVVLIVAVAVTVGVVLSLGGGSDDSPSQTTPQIATPSVSPVASPPTGSPVTKQPAPGSTPQPTPRPTPQPTPRPTAQPVAVGPTVKAFESTVELYQAVDNYMEDPTLTTEYGATMNDWDVSRIQVFDRVFDGSRNQAWYETDWCEHFSGCTQMLFNEDLNRWNTSNAVSMNAMFVNAREFNGDISTWDVSRVNSMRSLFQEVRAFNRDLSQWNTGSVTSMRETFQAASAFNQPIGNWNVARVTTTYAMFRFATSFNQDLSAWDVGAVMDATSMFSTADALNQDLCAWRTKLPSTANVLFMFEFADACPVDTTPISGVSDTPVLGETGQYWCHECDV